MKNKQKKLKAENFRYIKKRVIKNPMIYLDNFYGRHTSVDSWMRDVSLTINASVHPEMACQEIIENGFHCKQLIEQVEVAFIMFKQCRLKRQRKPTAFFQTRDDYIFYSSRGEYTSKGQTNPADTISKVFSFRSLKKWYEIFDDMMLAFTHPKSAEYSSFIESITTIHELLLRLAQAMYVIYREGGLPLQVPSYAIARAGKVFEGEMPVSKLGEMINHIMDKRQVEAAVELEAVFEKAYGDAKDTGEVKEDQETESI